MGRKIWGISGQPGIWSGDINSEHNSQYFADPYSFSHITHGILLYGLLWLTGRNLPVRIRALIVLAMEAGWEVLENSDMVINRCRAETISLHYYGDSVVNSMSDIMFCMMGFTLAYLLPTRIGDHPRDRTGSRPRALDPRRLPPERHHVDPSVLGHPHLASGDVNTTR